MTELFWASVIIAPAAFVVFVPFASYLFLLATKRALEVDWMRHVTPSTVRRPTATRPMTTMAIGFVALSQFLATALILDGFGSDPFAGLALALGLGEWVAALGWIGLLIVSSSPHDGPSTEGEE